MNRRLMTPLVALAAALLLAACSRESAPPAQPPVQEPSQPPVQEPAPPTQPSGPRFDDTVPESEVPQALRDWVASQAEQTEPAWKLITVGDESYLAATGGKKENGGWDVGLVRIQMPEPGGKPVVRMELVIVPPREGADRTGPLNPVHYFRWVPQLGPVQMEIKFLTSN